ncbi:MAG: bifunctional oligoribonuclease/PAP phosphatase NrnA [Brevinematia bacterium]
MGKMIDTKVMSTLGEIVDILRKEQKFVITFHVNPDYDAVGSALGMLYILREMGKDSVLVVSEEKREVFEKTFSFLPLWDEIEGIEKLNGMSLSDYVVIVLDSGEVKRIGKNFEEFLRKFKLVLNIDHHHDNELFGTYNLVNSEVVGTGEFVYQIAKEFGIQITKELASLIYSSIVGDGGSFRFDSVKPSTHRITAELLETGIEPSFFTMNMFQNKTVSFIKFEGEVFQNLKTCCENKVVWVIITDDLLRKYGLTDGEVEPVVEDIGRIKDAVIYFTIKEKREKGIISVALRSKGNIDVSKVARKLGGGGHKNASGIAFEMSMGVDKVEEMVIKEIASSFNDGAL